MPVVLFYEKPKCVTNAKQKKELRHAGCMVIERNLLEHGLSSEELYEFLKPLHVSDWFNPNAPKIKNAVIDVKSITPEDALDILVKEPILIRRPLMVIGERKFCGFERKKIKKIFGLELDKSVGEACNTNHVCEN
jgi:nitrogenase-associated protein